MAAKEPFLQVYAHTIVKTWEALQHYIDKKIHEEKDEMYMTPFKHLYDLASKYVMNNQNLNNKKTWNLSIHAFAKQK